MIEPTKQIGNNPRDLIQVLLIDPYTRRPVLPGGFGRYSSPTGLSLLVRHKNFEAADDDDTEIVAAVPGYSIAVVGYIVQSGATAQDITFKSDATAISHTMQNGAYGGATRPIIYGGNYFETLAGEPLVATTSSASGAVTTGCIDYVLIPDSSIVDEDGNPIVDENGNPIS